MRELAIHLIFSPQTSDYTVTSNYVDSLRFFVLVGTQGLALGRISLSNNVGLTP